eukprot:gene17095-18816_t
MGAAIDDQELAMTLLSSLPEEFKPLITALDAVGEDNMTFEKVKGMLLNDIDRNRDIGQSKSSENALYVKKSGGFKKGSGRHDRTGSTPQKFFRGTCHYCKQQGHFARDCPKKQSKDSDDSKKKPSKFYANYVAIQQEADDISREEALIASREEALITSDREMKSDWIIDSGATQHMTFNKTMLKNYVKFQNPFVVNLGDNRTILAYGKGSCHIISDLGMDTQRIFLNDVLYLPDLEKNLLSVRAMTNLDALVEFAGDECKISRNGKLLAIGQLVGKLYFLKLASDIHVNLVKNSISEKQLWHNRLGHLGMDNVKQLAKDNMVKGMKAMNHDKDFHDFTTEKSVNTELFYPDGWQSESAEEGHQPEPELVINQPVGETYEDRFMQEVQQLGQSRERRAPRRLVEEECNTKAFLKMNATSISPQNCHVDHEDTNYYSDSLGQFPEPRDRTNSEKSLTLSCTNSYNGRLSPRALSPYVFRAREFGPFLPVVLCILFAELCERMTYYGISGNLLVFLNTDLQVDASLASSIVLIFTGVSYVVPLFGGWIADTVAGKFNTLYGSVLIYLVGTALLPAVAYKFNLESNLYRYIFFAIALIFVSFGTGGIKANNSHGGRYSNGQVDTLLSLTEILPIFGTMILYWTVYNQMQTSFLLQGLNMDLHIGNFNIPAASLSLFDVVIILVLNPLMDIVIYPAFKKCGVKLTPLRRMGAGMVFAILSVIVAAIIEVKRREHVKDGHRHQISGKYYNQSSLTVFYQGPQYILIGISEVFASISGLEFAYAQSPRILQALVGSALVQIVEKASQKYGSVNWYNNDINKGKLDYFFYLLAILLGIDFLMFCVIAMRYTYVSEHVLRKNEEEWVQQRKGCDNEGHTDPYYDEDGYVSRSVISDDT